ncbi:MAG: hypothetical protein R3222_03605 [Balneolaceae bacterium]|nr:hypothetical protein [Balneolaceae bacterium]
MSENPDSLVSRLSKGNRINLAIVFILIILGIIFQGHFPEYDGHFGFWSVLPPLVAIVLAFWTKEVISALFVGIALGGVISGQPNLVEHFLLPSIGTESFAMILLVYLWSLGGLIGIWTRTGVPKNLLSGRGTSS